MEILFRRQASALDLGSGGSFKHFPMDAKIRLAGFLIRLPAHCAEG